MVAYKVIKTPLGDVHLGVECRKIVWCGFGCASWAQTDTQMCPSEEGVSWKCPRRKAGYGQLPLGEEA